MLTTALSHQNMAHVYSRKRLISLAIACLFLDAAKVNSIGVESQHYSTGKDRRCDEPGVATVEVRSKLECLALCERTSGCNAVNYERKTHQCDLLQRDENNECSVIDDVDSVYAEKTQATLNLNYVIDCKNTAFMLTRFKLHVKPGVPQVPLEISSLGSKPTSS